MRIERYTAPDSRSAMALVREDLGADALILANRRVGGQVEITAAVDVEQALANGDAAQVAPRSSTDRTGGASGYDHGVSNGTSTSTSRNDIQLKTLERELHRLQGILEQELGQRQWQDSAGQGAALATLRQRLLRLGLSRRLTGTLLDRVPAEAQLEQGWRLALAELSDRLPAHRRESRAPGITAVYGGTGVGKTSTVARLAARDVRVLGAAQVGLVSLDSFRAGAQEQLAACARAIGVPVQLAHDSRSLSRALRKLRNRRVYIDTAGMSQHDARLRGQYEMVRSLAESTAGIAGEEVEHLLVLAASAQASQCRALASIFGPGTLSGAIISKVDEAQTLGGILDVVISAELALVGFSDGQRIPEDLHDPDPRELLRRAAALTAADHTITAPGVRRTIAEVRV